MTLKDFTYECTSPEDWVEYSMGLPDGMAVDEIGNIPQGLIQAPAGTDEMDPMFDEAAQVWCVNARVDDATTPTPRLSEMTLGNEHVKWIDPAAITNPIRGWSGGMSYYVPPQVEATSTKRGKRK